MAMPMIRMVRAMPSFSQNAERIRDSLITSYLNRGYPDHTRDLARETLKPVVLSIPDSAIATLIFLRMMSDLNKEKEDVFLIHAGQLIKTIYMLFRVELIARLENIKQGPNQ